MFHVIKLYCSSTFSASYILENIQEFHWMITYSISINKLLLLLQVFSLQYASQSEGMGLTLSFTDIVQTANARPSTHGWKHFLCSAAFARPHASTIIISMCKCTRRLKGMGRCTYWWFVAGYVPKTTIWNNGDEAETFSFFSHQTSNSGFGHLFSSLRPWAEIFKIEPNNSVSKQAVHSQCPNSVLFKHFNILQTQRYALHK